MADKQSKSIKATGGPGGRRPGAGRRVGSRNKRTQAVLEVIQLAGKKLPLDMLLELMNAPEPTQKPDEDSKLFLARAIQWREERLEAAKAAAPYCHPKLASVEHRGPGEGGKFVHEIRVKFVE